MIARTLALSALLAVGACAYPYSPHALPPVSQLAPPASGAPVAAATAQAAQRVPVILVSIDGFRPDYLDRGVTPNLSRLAADGVSAAMRPSFPSKTFPNHWTLVTGLRPDRHGIVANNMEDAARPGEKFTMATDDPFWWNAAEPIWVTAQKAGIHAAAMFWPGSNVGWGGVRGSEWPNTVQGGMRPDDWQQFTQQMPGENRVRAVIDWLRRPPATRPGFITLYFDTVDTAGHQYGPASQQVTDAVAQVDRWIGDLVAGLAELRQPANLVIVADHGMAPTSSDRVIALDKLVSPDDARLIEAGPYASFEPVPGHERAVEAALLKPHAHLTCWRKGDIPVRFHYGSNPRVPPYFCLAEDGWMTMKTAPASAFTRGEHGYDNDQADMRALFIASGPAFASGRKLPTFDNVDVAPLLRDLLGLPAGKALDGTDAPFRAVLEK
ncbi:MULTISPECIES: ectonucleotide pyrophosphatase/phosphodiesterase [unclassified Sphingomonas]|uniref:alkaline phosphatase family protein n=1 Tax=unclassified Sphingomonas TaxID=196159 RepID=UPI0009272043|nr:MULTISPECIES: ectonucleotide pyrophosphatase/phosphodiesterase [unclassified Sphingomonas]MBN8846587.1 alkaline phosphatase family protein [Sphingomonas sp.]OJV32783.1 MAG: alkaline phosphatase family protein [Sphingomonas sp. 67-36]